MSGPERVADAGSAGSFRSVPDAVFAADGVPAAGGGAGGVDGATAGVVAGATGKSLHKPIPSTGERIPVIGMGTWITFDVARDTDARNQRVEVRYRPPEDEEESLRCRTQQT